MTTLPTDTVHTAQGHKSISNQVRARAVTGWTIRSRRSTDTEELTPANERKGPLTENSPACDRETCGVEPKIHFRGDPASQPHFERHLDT